jgi:phenylpropionate dioxygenase-like ring-hydroxylating dioxygenase large terminal subunit
MAAETATVGRTWKDLAERFVAFKRESETQLADDTLLNPAWVYTDAKHFELEWETLFRRTPVAVGLISDVKQPGDYLTANVGGTYIMVVRDDDGSLNGFVNVCRHRGTRLVDHSGHLSARIRCPYHAWTYDFGGRLSSTPYSGGGFDTLPMKDISLGKLPVWERHGIVYVAASADVEPGAIEDLDQLAPDFAAIGLEDFTFFREETSVWPMNWKLAMDAFLEHYHIFSLHRRSVADIFVPVPSVFDEKGWNSRMCVFRKHTPPTVEGLETDEEFRKSGNLSYVLFPNAVINLPVSGQAELWQILPDAHDQVRVMVRFYTKDPVDTASKMRFWSKNFEMSRDVNQVEDFPLQMTVHDSLFSGAIDHLIYGRNEPALIYYHQLLARRLGTSHG